jgi:nucleoporin NUP1
MDISSGVPNFFASSKAFSNSLDIPVAPLNFKLSPPQPIEEHTPTMFLSAASTDAGHLPTETETKTEFKASIATNDSASTFLLTARETALSMANMSPGSTPLLPLATGFTIKTERATSLDQGQPDEVMQTTQISAAEPKRTVVATDSMIAGVIHPFNESNAASISSIVKGSSPDKPALNLLTSASITSNDLALGGQDFASVPNSNIASKTSSVPVSNEPVPPASSFAPSTASGKPRSPPFNLTNESAASKPSFGGFNFQIAGVADKVKSQAPVVSSSTSSSTVAQPDQKKETIGFAFQPQPSASASTSLFAFGGGGSVASDVSKPFSFGTSAGSSLGRPVTPPKAQDQEVQMDESPTRDVQSSNVKPTMSGFSFSQTPTSSSLFGTQTSGNTPSSSPFNFERSSRPLASNPFATSVKEVKPVQKKPIDFSQTSSFPFGQNAKAPDVAGTVQSPTSGPFSFGPSTNTFAFGPSSSSNNPFGQPQAGSAPSSPASFGASPFSFGTSAPNPAFMFGSSQPASPVGGTNLSLPQPSTSSFGNSGFGQSAPSSPFSTTSPLAPSAPSAPLFTIGSAPMAAPGAPRQIKKLPSRRSGPKR